MAKYAAITGWGMAVPERVLTNAELERMVWALLLVLFVMLLWPDRALSFV